MKQIQLNSGVFLLVDVPESGKSFEMPEQDYGAIVQYKGNNKWLNTATLPTGQWEIIGKGNEITEGVWDEIIGKDYVVSGKRERILILKLKNNA